MHPNAMSLRCRCPPACSNIDASVDNADDGDDTDEADADDGADGANDGNNGAAGRADRDHRSVGSAKMVQSSMERFAIVTTFAAQRLTANIESHPLRCGTNRRNHDGGYLAFLAMLQRPQLLLLPPHCWFLSFYFGWTTVVSTVRDPATFAYSCWA